MRKRPDVGWKLECINKFSVVVSYQFGKYIFLKISLLSLFMKTSFFGNPSHFIGFLYTPMQTISEINMSSLRNFGSKDWILNYPLHKVT